MSGTIICYGDSNTYGYDARPYLGARFPVSVRWPEILNARTDWDVENYGLNGRCILKCYNNVVTGVANKI